MGALDRLAARLGRYTLYLVAASLAGPAGCVLVVYAGDFVPDELTTRSLLVLLWLTVNHWAALAAVVLFAKLRLPDALRRLLAVVWLLFAVPAFVVPVIIWFQ